MGGSILGLAFTCDALAKLGISDQEFRVIFGKTKIEFDAGKEQVNRAKHGYSLASAIEQLERMLLPIGAPPPRMTSDGVMEEGEMRHMHMGVDDLGKIIFMVTTMRPNETVRIISYRRASPPERERFFQCTGYREPES